MENKLIAISGYWKDDKSEFHDYLVSELDEIDEVNDDNIFYYGISLEFIKSNLNNLDGILDFVITSYRENV
jgi:hypothetical protein